MNIFKNIKKLFIVKNYLKYKNSKYRNKIKSLYIMN